MNSTELAYGATRLRGHLLRRPRRPYWYCSVSAYAMSSTELAYACIGLRDFRYCCANCFTELANGGIRLRASHGMCRTELARGGTR
eukprot:3057169-Rhodomonas_salina.1